MDIDTDSLIQIIPKVIIWVLRVVVLKDKGVKSCKVNTQDICTFWKSQISYYILDSKYKKDNIRIVYNLQTF